VLAPDPHEQGDLDAVASLSFFAEAAAWLDTRLALGRCPGKS
jgi:hypothetical protein